ncbi:MAG: phosphate/phosphite/phosphonate ABC transporter substrate-binding protein [Methylococcaceae bacterium]|nr:phosphate/phosphite/phosphonate ABC transporter substrate-binding protein [Methylococcaceae bacterium]
MKRSSPPSLPLLPTLLALLMLLACTPVSESDYSPEYGSAPAAAVREYLFGVHPLHNPERLNELFGPIMDYLGERIPGVRFRLEASRNYAAFEDKLYGRRFDFALPNPYQTVKALERGYRVFGKMGNDEDFRGIILVRKDSPIRDIADLEGGAISFPAPTALAAAMLPQYYLQTHGLDVMKDVELRYVGSQESSIMNVYLGQVAAGATWPPPWRAFAKEHPEVDAALKVMWQTAPLPNNSLMARDDMDPNLVAQVGTALFGLQEHARGKVWLERMAVVSFVPADEHSYAPVRDFLEEFRRTVRPLEGP